MANSLKSDLFNRYLQVHELDLSQRYTSDQLTRELEEFVRCLRTGQRPRADGMAGQNALAPSIWQQYWRDTPRKACPRSEYMVAMSRMAAIP